MTPRARWRKSSYSGMTDNSDCVEVARLRWQKSTYSGMTDDSSCVELARLSEAVGVRDSKDPNAGSLVLPAGAFADLVARIKRDELVP